MFDGMFVLFTNEIYVVDSTKNIELHYGRKNVFKIWYYHLDYIIFYKNIFA